MASDRLTPAIDLAADRTPLFPNESAEYAIARNALLAEEIEFRRHEVRLAAQRRALPPGPVIDKDWKFKDDQGQDASLADLFGELDTLVTYYWMFGPERERPCPMCTNVLGSLNGNAVDIRQRVALKILARSPVSRQYAFAQERGWHDLQFVQTIGDDYAKDLRLLAEDGSDTAAQVVYRKDGDQIRVFWAAEAGFETADPGEDSRLAPDWGVLWTILDLTPEGRGKNWYPRLSY